MDISLPGYLLADYKKDLRIEKQISSGGESVVYKGTLLSLELKKLYAQPYEFVAIKQQNDNPKLSKEEADARFLHEVAVLSGLSFHPNIIKLLSFTQEPNTIVTPLYEGSLQDFIHSKSRVYNSVDLADISYQFSSALDAIHSQQRAHRDIKASNIFIERRQTYSIELKLDENSQLKVVNAFGLSFQYAAPEAFSDLAANFTRADLEDFQFADMYSFGILLWELVHPEMPWQGLNKQATQNEVVSGNRPKISFQTQQDNKVLFVLTAIEACWNQDPNGRPLPRNLVKQLRGLMEMEAYPYVQTII